VKKIVIIASLSMIQNEREKDENNSITGSQMGGDGDIGILLGKSTIAVILVCGTLIEDGY
jgi:hypothetical protein